MTIYILVYLILCLLTLSEIFLNDKIICRLAAAFFVFLFFGLRSELGNDWIAYKGIHEALSNETFYDVMFNSEFSGMIEIGYRFLDRFFVFILSDVDFSFFVLQLFVTAGLIFSVTTFVKKTNLKNGVLFFLCFFATSFYRDFDLIRQSLALSFFLLAIANYSNNLRFIFILLVATLFHASVIILIPTVIFFKQTVRTFVFKAFTVLALVGLLFSSFISDIFRYLFAFFYQFFDLEKLSLYIEGALAFKSFGLLESLMVLSLLILLFNTHALLNRSKIDNYIVIIALISCYIYIIAPSQELFERVSYYTQFSFIYIIIRFIDLPRVDYDKKYMRFAIALCMLYPLLRFQRIVSNPDTEIVIIPYTSIFENSDYSDIRRVSIVDKGIGGK